MKAKILKVLLNVFLYLIFVLLWGAILFVLTFIRIFDTFLDRFADGALLTIFAVISVTGLIIPILFIRKMKHTWMLPLLLIVSTIVTTIVNCGVLYCASDYMSVYTREKWDKYPWERGGMIYSLNEQYEFIGMTEQEVTAILGDPDRIFERNDYTIYQYVVGDAFKEWNAYDFIFENGIVTDNEFSHHSYD